MSGVDREAQVVQNLMRQPEGRAFMMRLIQHAGVDADTFHDDTHRNAYNMGKRSQGLMLAQELQRVDKDLYLKMIEEDLHDGR